MENKRCLIIADDLTGAADTGVQFVSQGLDTCLISPDGAQPIDFNRYQRRDVLVVNTHSRGLDARQASERIALLLKDYRRDPFPLVYKKIDSTLRGNMGSEIDALMEKTGLSIGFMAPSFPEQKRSLVGGIMMVDGKPLSQTEAAQDSVSPIHESHVHKILGAQSRMDITRIDLTHVASTVEKLHDEVMRECISGKGMLIIFDAVTHKDLRNVAEVGFRMPQPPLLIGSAGLAREIAEELSASAGHRPFSPEITEAVHVLIVSGSASGVTHGQIRRLEETGSVSSFDLGAGVRPDDEKTREEWMIGTAGRMGEALRLGHVLLKSPLERLEPRVGISVQARITYELAVMARHALVASGMPIGSLMLVATGGDTAMAILQALNAEELHILGQVIEGVAMSRLAGGAYEGLRIVTKAGAFGEADALKKIIGIVTGKTLEPSDSVHP
jgi:D-threonate/D-erythronate kinase